MTSPNIITKQNFFEVFKKKRKKACLNMLKCLIACYIVDKAQNVKKLLL